VFKSFVALRSRIRLKGFDREGKILFCESPGPEEGAIELNEILFLGKNHLDSVRFVLITEFNLGREEEGALLVFNDEIRSKIIVKWGKQLEKELQEIAKELE
jgi:hypothetical protein